MTERFSASNRIPSRSDIPEVDDEEENAAENVSPLLVGQQEPRLGLRPEFKDLELMAHRWATQRSPRL